MANIEQISSRSTYRRIPQGGAFSASSFNSTIEEIVSDLTDHTSNWNTKLYPLLKDLPDDAWIGGLAGETVYSYSDATSSDTGLFWNSTGRKPNTVRQSLLYLSGAITDAIAAIQQQIRTVDAVSSYTKAYIGQKAFDSTLSSSTTSMDGKISRNLKYIQQIAKDMLGSNYVLTGAGNQTLTNPLGKLIKALLDLHSGSAYLNEVAFTGTAIALAHNVNLSEVNFDRLILQTEVDNSADYTPLARGVPTTNLQNDLNRLRWEIEHTRGAGWETTITPAYIAGPTNLQNHVIDIGSGTAGASNPHGQVLRDFTGAIATLNTINVFTGRSGDLDATPAYSSQAVVTNGDSLETAIGKLDAYTQIMVAHETLYPKDLGTDDPAIANDPTLGYYTSTGSNWSQNSQIFPDPGADDVTLLCTCTVPRAYGGKFPKYINVAAHLVGEATEALKMATFVCTAFDYEGSILPNVCTDGRDMDPLGTGLPISTISQTGWTANKFETFNFGIFIVEKPRSGEFRFKITRLAAGDDYEENIHLLSVAVDWYGPLV